MCNAMYHLQRCLYTFEAVVSDKIRKFELWIFEVFEEARRRDICWTNAAFARALRFFGYGLSYRAGVPADSSPD